MTHPKKSLPKTVLITGAARRIGASLIRFFHERHYNVIIHCHHSIYEAKALLQECLAKRPHSALLYRAPLEKKSAIEKLITAIQTRVGRLDVLINNASQFFPTPLGTLSQKTCVDLLKINWLSPLFLAEAAFPLLKKTKGCIINISDSHAPKPVRDYSVYGSTKAALNAITQSLALELAPFVRVNAIAPGSTLWPEGKNRLSAQAKKKRLSQIPLQQQTSLAAIAQTALFLVENQSMTGQIIAIDGGKNIVIK